MSEIAKCPICGNKPGWHDFDIEARVFGGERSYFCCGMKAATAILWNHYAAAMELADSLSSLDKCDAKTQHLWEQHVDMAEKRVLEVFK